MRSTLLLLMRRRLVWLLLLLGVWLLCSGQAQAGPLAQRLEQFPQWSRPPALDQAQGDLAYPAWFEGTWTLTSTLVDAVAPLAPDLVSPGFEGNQSLMGEAVVCPVRFTAEPRSVLPGLPLTRGRQVVSDRAYNGLSLARAYLGDEAVKSVKVDPNNPNRQVTLLRGSRQLESTVAGRQTEAPNGDTFITSELFRQVFRGTAQPFLNQVENTTAYHYQGADIVADQVTAIYLSPQDPDYFKAQGQPVALYRYRLSLQPATG